MIFYDYYNLTILVHEAYLALLDGLGLVSEERPLMHFASAGITIQNPSITPR
jgi:hypothetical protein